MNPKFLLHFLLIPISFKIPPYSPLTKGGWGGSNPLSQGGRQGSKLNTEEGFTIIDVIIGMLIAFLFLMASLQAMVVEAYFRIAGQASSEGLLLIQQDLEEVRFKASLAELTNNTNTSIDECNATATNNGYANTLAQTKLSMTMSNQTINGVTGYQGTQTKSNVSINNLKYNLTRQAKVSDTSPYNILELNYTVNKVEDGKTVATLYTEVIPDAAFQCN